MNSSCIIGPRAVNVSPRQFRQESFVAQVAEASRAAGADPRQLKLELTESLMLDDFARVADKMHALKRTGIGKTRLPPASRCRHLPDKYKKGP